MYANQKNNKKTVIEWYLVFSKYQWFKNVEVKGLMHSPLLI
jgi:hypothetical protein